MRIAGIALICAAAALMGSVTGQENASSTPEQDQKTQSKFPFWMEVKLEKSQDIFEALAQGDFPTIIDNAESLKSLNSLEGFVRRSNVDYRRHLQSFEFAVKEIQKQAEKENIEAVALGFQQLTLSCVKCHQHLRQPQRRKKPAAAESVRNAPQ